MTLLIGKVKWKVVVGLLFHEKEVALGLLFSIFDGVQLIDSKEGVIIVQQKNQS
jgi:hypothetical protein